MPKFTVECVGDGVVTLKVANQQYQNTFALKGEGGTLAAGAKVVGTIHAPAWKAEKVELGGNYVEPLFGRPRRMQGTILAVKPETNELVVQVGYEVMVKLPAKYKASDFAVGERVGWDNVEMPAFVVG